MLSFNNLMIEKLVHLSKENWYNYYELFNWPKTLEVDKLWCNEDLLTSYGTEIHDQLTEQKRFELSKWEAINFYSLNVHGIKGALEFISASIYKPRYLPISEYMHIFLMEENAHMWFFAKFCQLYAGKIYPQLSLKTDNTTSELEKDFYMFVSTLIFEEYVDFYNHKVGKNENVPPIVKEINYQHHVDESRHVSFGRNVIKELYNEILSEGNDDDRIRISETIEGMFMYFIGLMYNPQVYRDAGLEGINGLSCAALRNHLRNSPYRKDFHSQWFKRTADYFIKCGILTDTNFLTN